METNLRQNVAGGIIVFFVFPVFISELFGFKWFGRNDINLFECFVLVFLTSIFHQLSKLSTIIIDRECSMDSMESVKFILTKIILN